MPISPSAVIVAYALFLIVGGIVGWRKSGSRVSLTASLISAALLSIAYRISLNSPFAGYLMAAIIAFALALVFFRRFRKTKKFMPAGMMLILSTLVCLVMAWFTIFA